VGRKGPRAGNDARPRPPGAGNDARPRPPGAGKKPWSKKPHRKGGRPDA
jgi:hypothetical protein